LSGKAQSDLRVISEKRVVELDGGRQGPFDRGACTSLLHVSSGAPVHYRSGASDTPKDVAKIVQEKYIDRAGGDINFNMMVLAGEPDE
jgi:ubiquitin carboxyl-terminal hydrolase L3